MAAPLDRDVVFGALTRPQMFAGVTYSYFVLNGVVTAELFLITKSFWAIAAALVIHAIGYVACLREPRIFDLWLTKVSRCPRVPNFRPGDATATSREPEERSPSAGKRLPYARPYDDRRRRRWRPATAC
jgi:type IV secretion system protein VirB3